MKPLSTIIIVMLLVGILFSVSGGIRAQQGSGSTQQLSERLLDAVDGNDVEAVRSILAIASGRSLVALPIGLTAAGRAVERGYYEVAHHILAVRTQQIQLEKEERAANSSTEGTSPLATRPPESASPAKKVRRKSPPARLKRQTPGPHTVIVPTPASKLPPEKETGTRAPTSEAAPPLSGPNPFEPSHTPGVELPRAHPLGQPDSRSDRSDTSPAARVAAPPDLPLRGSPKNTTADTAPARNLPTPVSTIANAVEPEKAGFFGRLLDTVSNTFIQEDSEPKAGKEKPGTQETVRSPDLSHTRGGTPPAPSESIQMSEAVSSAARATPSDGILGRLARFISSNDSLENSYPLNNSAADTPATETESAPGLKASARKGNAEDEMSSKAEPTKPGRSASPPKESLSPDPGKPGFIDFIKRALSSGAPMPEPEIKESLVSPTGGVNPLDPSPRDSSENTAVNSRKNAQATASKIVKPSPTPKKPTESEPEEFPREGRMAVASPPAVEAPPPPVHIRLEKKGNPFEEKYLTLLSSALPASQKNTFKTPARSSMIQPKTRTKAIRSGSAKNKLAATAIVRAQKQGVLKKAAHPKAKAAASGGKENNLPTFRIGKFLTLGRSLNPKAVASGQCFRKGRDTDWYCLEHANWPQKMARAMGVSAWHYRKEATVVQYKYGKAVRIYSVIPSKTYEDAVEYYSNLIGPPTKVLSDKLARLGNTPLSNPSSFWVNASNKGSTETLEIRKFDNIRGLMAYETMGLVRLFKENSDPIFAILSDTDLILHQIRANNRK